MKPPDLAPWLAAPWQMKDCILSWIKGKISGKIPSRRNEIFSTEGFRFCISNSQKVQFYPPPSSRILHCLHRRHRYPSGIIVWTQLWLHVLGHGEPNYLNHEYNLFTHTQHTQNLDFDHKQNFKKKYIHLILNTIK